MNAQEILASPDFKRCVEFHGHICPGLSIGYRATKLAMERLQANRAADEELVAIVETDACCVDAVQVLTGCTFGKGNFIYRDYGKVAFSFLSRESGRGLRVVLRPDAMPVDERHGELMARLKDGTATPAERQEFSDRHRQKSLAVLGLDAERLFEVKPVEVAMPAKAKVEPSENCVLCGEAVMRAKLELVAGRKICRGCRERLGT
ncbi:MAG: FmdE, Molybdenum formylmethanofuran dehydrogenase operon [Deltaproteobacteria bacterium ADurb.Bin510]|nr:MAG: FmdE, Molybdenum formylmethanofuran dehydrogenase operon [Deltaproteobacteria bacterium ADurb.Bin510]